MTDKRIYSLLYWHIRRQFANNKKRPSKGWSGIHLLHDNASSHKCEVVKSFLASEKVKVLNHPLVQYILQQITKEDYLSAFHDWVKRLQKCVSVSGGGGEYFEGL